MEERILLVSGLIFLLGLVFSRILEKVKLPAVTSYLILGVILGPYVLDIIPDNLMGSMSLIADTVLSMVAFSLGQVFEVKSLSRVGKRVFLISWGEVIGAFILVTVVMNAIGVPLYEALLFGGIAPATAPAATVMVIRELRASGPFTETLLGVVAIDDAWGIMVFALAESVAKMLLRHGGGQSEVLISLLHATVAVIAALALGAVVAFLFKWLSKFFRSDTDILVAVFGAILITSDIASYFNLSNLLANMAFGAVLANSVKSPNKYFDILKRFDWLFYLFFFVLSGASLEVEKLKELGIWGIIYTVARPFGEYVGAFVGAAIGKMEKTVRNYIGLGLVPQAGVALGLAILVRHEFSDTIGPGFLTIIIASTVISEIVGPVFTRIALRKAGEIRA